jgi:hypothetical protein
MDENVQVKTDNPVGESFDIIYDVYLPSKVVIPAEDMETAMHTVNHFRKTKYPTGEIKVVRRETLTKETTVYVDNP